MEVLRMKHIKEEYGQPYNKIESTIEEFYILKDFLRIYGVEARKCSICDGICTWQIRNGYKDWANLYSNDTITGQNIIDIVEKNITDGNW